MRKFIDEIIRRRVLPVVVAYAIGGWILLQVGDVLIGLLELPSWLGKALVAVIVLGLPVAILLSWIYDWTPKGIVVTDDSAERRRTFEFSEPAPIEIDAFGLVRPRSTPLIGRDRECAILSKCLTEARSGRGGIVLVGGEPGVGKTRLAEQALIEGHDNGMLPLVGHAYEESGAPFVTATEILEEVARVLPQDELRNVLGNTAPQMALLVPDLRRTFPDMPGAIDLPPEQQQRYLFNSVLEFVTRLSKAAPLVVLLDDLQWGDESSTMLLEHVAPHLPRLPVLFVITYRDVAADMREPFRRALAMLSRQDYTTRIPLHALGRDEVAALLASLGGADPPQQVVDRIFEETDGNAFFVQSVFRHLSEEARLFDADGNWLTDIDAESLAVPDSVRLVIQRRLERLSDETRHLLARAAVMGQRFDLGVVGTVSAAAADDVLTAIEAGEQSGLVFPAAGNRSSQYNFSHALVRQTVLEELSIARRQHLHLQFAEALEQACGADDRYSADIAMHLYRAGDLADAGKTRQFLLAAGDHALATAAPDEAFVAFQRALEIEQDMTETERATLLYKLGFAFRTLGRHEEMEATWHEAVPLLEAQQQTDYIVDACRHLSYYYAWQQAADKAAAVAERGLDAIGGASDRGRCRLLAALGLAYSSRLEFSQADEAIAESVALATRLGDLSLLGGEALLARLLRYEHTLRVDDLLKTTAEAMVLVQQHGTAWEQTSTIGAGLLALAWKGDFATLRERIEAIRPVAEKEGNLGAIAHCVAAASMAAVASDDFDLSQRASSDCIELGDNYQLPWCNIGYAMRGVTLLWRGEHEAAAADFRHGVEHQLTAQSHFGVEAAVALYGLAMMGHDGASALYDADYPLPVLDQDSSMGAWPWCMARIQSAVLLDRTEDAAPWLPHVERLMAQGLKLVMGIGLAAKFAGLAAAAAGNAAAADKHFTTAIRQADELPYHTEQAETRRWYAWALQYLGHADDGARVDELRAAAAAKYESLGGFRPL